VNQPTKPVDFFLSDLPASADYKWHRRDDNSIDLWKLYTLGLGHSDKDTTAHMYLLEVERVFRIGSRQAAAVAIANARRFQVMRENS
jgi:hypothetical protein